MDDTAMVAAYVAIDDVLRAAGHRTHPLARTSDSEVLTVAVAAACRFGNHHERAVCVLRGMGYLSGPLSVSRFNRRAHALADWLVFVLGILGEVFALGATAFTLDSLPLPVCRRVRARRSKKVQGAEYYGYCAAKEEPGALWAAYGWRLHLLCDDGGVPVGFEVLPASLHDLAPLLDLAQCVPAGATIYGDKAYNSGDDEAWPDGECGVRPVPVRRKNMEQNTAGEWLALQRHRAAVEGVNSQLAAWGVQRLHARTHEGWLLKGLASVLALVVVNAA